MGSPRPYATTPSRACLSRLLGAAGPLQALWRGPAGGGMHLGAGPGHLQIHPHPRHLAQPARPAASQRGPRVDISGPRPCAWRELLPMTPNTDKPNMMMNTTLNQLRSLRLET